MDHQKAVLGLATAEVTDKGITAVAKREQVRRLGAKTEAANVFFFLFFIKYLIDANKEKAKWEK